MKIKLLIAGTGYIELANIARNGFTYNGDEIEVIGYLDDNPENKSRKLQGMEILGGFSDINKYPDAYVINSIARNMKLRAETTRLLSKYGAKFTNIIHKSSSYSKFKLGIGSFIGPNTVIEPNVEIGSHCCILSSSVISHDSKLGDVCFLGHNTTISGNVKINDEVFIGAGSVVYPNINIENSSIIGINSTVISDVKSGSSISAPLSKRIK